MTVTDMIRNKLRSFKPGYVFTYEDVIDDVSQRESVVKALNRMVKSDVLCKLSQGKYYKPEESAFGKLEPDQYQIVKDLLEKDGKPVGYLTGLSIYNALGLTTQVSNTIQIGKNDVRNTFTRGKYTISFVRQKNEITKDNIQLLQLLDSIRYIKQIPDSTVESAVKRMLSILKQLSSKQIELMIKLSLKYPPSTRALLGALVTDIGVELDTDALYKSLNPITTYKLSGADTVLQNAESWNIR